MPKRKPVGPVAPKDAAFASASGSGSAASGPVEKSGVKADKDSAPASGLVAEKPKETEHEWLREVKRKLAAVESAAAEPIADGLQKFYQAVFEFRSVANATVAAAPESVPVFYVKAAWNNDRRHGWVVWWRSRPETRNVEDWYELQQKLKATDLVDFQCGRSDLRAILEMKLHGNEKLLPDGSLTIKEIAVKYLSLSTDALEIRLTASEDSIDYDCFAEDDLYDLVQAYGDETTADD